MDLPKRDRFPLLKEGKVIDLQAQMKRKDRSIVWVMLSSTVRTNNGDNCRGRYDEHHSAEEDRDRLRIAQKKLRAMASEIVMTDERSSSTSPPTLRALDHLIKIIPHIMHK